MLQYRVQCRAAIISVLNMLAFLQLCVIQGGSHMTGTDLCVNKPHCAAAVRP